MPAALGAVTIAALSPKTVITPNRLTPAPESSGPRHDERDENVHPDASEFGLDLDEVRSRFATYTTRANEWTERNR